MNIHTMPSIEHLISNMIIKLSLFYSFTGVDAKGKGLYYKGFLDCLWKILTKEGPIGFYKGWSASWFRLVPHTILSLVIWEETRQFYKKLKSWSRWNCWKRLVMLIILTFKTYIMMKIVMTIWIWSDYLWKWSAQCHNGRAYYNNKT